MTTMTLDLPENVLHSAQDYAKEHGTSLAQLIAEYVVRLSSQVRSEQQELPPITKSLIGVLRETSVDEGDYHAYLEEKYL